MLHGQKQGIDDVSAVLVKSARGQYSRPATWNCHVLCDAGRAFKVPLQSVEKFLLLIGYRQIGIGKTRFSILGRWRKLLYQGSQPSKPSKNGLSCLTGK